MSESFLVREQMLCRLVRLQHLKTNSSAYIRFEDAVVVEDAESFKTQVLQVSFNFLHMSRNYPATADHR